MAMHPIKTAIRIIYHHRFASIISLVAVMVFKLVIPAPAMEARLVYEARGYSAGSNLSRPLGIFYDTPTDEIYVADTGNRQVVVYDANGIPVYRFFHHVTSDGKKQLGEPRSIAVDGTGRIYVTDTTVPYLDVLDLNGRTLATLEPPRTDCAEYSSFSSLALGPDGLIYAAFTCGKKMGVAVVNEDLRFHRILELENGVGGSSCATSIGVDNLGRIYVTDPCADLMIQIYSPDGAFVSGFGRHDAGFENFSHPTDITVVESGDLWIVDTVRQVVSCFTPGGDFVSYVGGKGDHPGAFNYPVALASDGSDRLFVVERAGNRFQCFQIVDDDAETAKK